MSVSPKNASAGTTVTVTVKPDSGYVLGGLRVTDKNGDDVKLTDQGNGKYTFAMPAGGAEVSADFVKETKENPFTDVPSGAYYYDAVLWAVENGVTDGVTATLFAPDASCTRAQIVTFLWRAAGSPAPKSASNFTDVPADAYYAKAVAWAVENGITGGTGSGKTSALQALEALGGTVLDCDAVYHQALREDETLRRRIRDALSLIHI